MPRDPRSAPVPFLSLLVLLAVGQLATPAAAKRVLVASSSMEVAKWALKAAAGAGHDVDDGSEVYDRTHALVFDLNEERPPGSWPPAIRDAWETGMAACQSHRTQPTFTIKDKDAWLCSRDLAPALWQRYLDHRSPELVVEVAVRAADAPDVKTVEVRAYEPGSTTARRLQVRTTSPDLATAELVRDALVNRGRFESRQVVRELPQKRARPATMTAPSTNVTLRTPVKVPESCTTLPSALTVRASSEHEAAYVQGAWMTAIPAERRSGAGQTCQLSSTDVGASNSILARTAMKSFSFTLTCPGRPAVQQRGLGISALNALEGAAPKLLQTFIDDACKAP